MSDKLDRETVSAVQRSRHLGAPPDPHPVVWVELDTDDPDVIEYLNEVDKDD